MSAILHNIPSWHENSSGILDSGCNHLMTSNQVWTSPSGIEYRPGSIAWTTPAGTMNSKGEFGSGHYMEIWAWIISWEAEAKTMWQIRGNSDVLLHWICHCNVSCQRTTQIFYTIHAIGLVVYTLKTGAPVEDVDSILKLPWGGSHPDIRDSKMKGIWVSIHPEWVYWRPHFPDTRQYILTEDQIGIAVHLRLFRV